VFDRSGVKKENTLEDVFKKADVVSLHLPLTDETKNIVNIDLLKKMKNTALIINTSRGPLINEDDLIFSLENKIIAGAGLDVLNKEPLDPGSRLAVMDNVIITPHAGYYSNESFVQLKILAAEECVRVLSGEEPKHWYNRMDFAF
jgi:D-3-phosphoglycerate dehydrogenase